MKENFLKIIFILDESGSMQGTESDVIGGFNQFLEQQKAKAYEKSSVSLYKFNSSWSKIFSDLPLNEIRPLQTDDYTPGGLTALYDAIGTAISEADKQNRHTRPGHIAESRPGLIAESTTECAPGATAQSKPDMVMMVIITDGQENASREYDSQRVKRLIQKHEQNENWQFIYLGSDLSNFADAEALGFKYKASSYKANLQQKFNIVSEHAILFRKCNLKEDKEQMMSDFVADLEDNYKETEQ
ncbi:MAG: VWA domain-containing protein [Bacteroidales bacterium]|nr:VWA domain-containing protein [Bacteroidales bacterium]MDD4641538.1 VWA domain-containing protein [Bacteroidales bacterium]